MIDELLRSGFERGTATAFLFPQELENASLAFEKPNEKRPGTRYRQAYPISTATKRKQITGYVF